ncbi:ankyrin repeat protein [Trichoderma pleuroticola]
MVRLLIEHGADINASVGELGRTSLHDAVAENDAKMVELLLENGADVSAVDGSGMTALQIAASLGHVDAAGVLLQQKGAKK